MIDTDGREWLGVDAAASRVRVRPGTIRVWVTRGKVAAHRIGAHRYVLMADVQRAEREWRRRMTLV